MAGKEREVSESERILLTPKHLRSAVWRFFGFWSVKGEIIDKTNVICKLCKKPLLYHSTTTNLRTHMQSCHPEEFSRECNEEGPALKQSRVTTFYTANTTPLPSAKQEEITQKLTEFICKDMRPISIVDGEGFQNFVRALNPRYNFPSRVTVSNRIAKLYDCTTKSVKELLNNRSVALTTDGWTSLHTDAYVTVTAHFISDDWEIKNYVLKTEELREKHTAENVSDCILHILGAFEIKPESVISVTTDNAGNYVKAVESHMKRPNIPCLAHTLNLAVCKGLRGVRAIETAISKLKMTAAHFSKSAVDSYLLEKKQKLLEVKSDKLINDCPTRWNSTYDMINRALEQQAPVAAVIFEKKMSHLELNTSEWVLMEMVKNVLQPFKTATEALSTDKYPTASAVLPLQHVLLMQLQPNSDNSSAVKEMKMKIAADLQGRYPNEKQAFMLLNTASYLDPRFHRLNHLPEEQKKQVRAKILSELTTIMEEAKNERTDAVKQPDARKKTALSAMGNLFDDVYSQTQSSSEESIKALEHEMDMYDREATLPADENPLSWWQKSCGMYPHIAQLAKTYLTIPGTSVRAERVFSSAGNIVNKKRSALAADQVDRLVFLTNNM
ncbi:E3 SUMO-protein ligase ZBED1-like [Misgurnus anguillicaudatus]|uniref:E3 SUMO-protein ligase ZBED1-like n=1 Tax=Misgurnus anguillicaudatus TaxID=75329 RepID=UPI003CCFD9C8